MVGTESGAKYIQIAGAVAEGHHIAFVCHRLVADGGAAGSASYRLVAKYAAPYPAGGVAEAKRAAAAAAGGVVDAEGAVPAATGGIEVSESAALVADSSVEVTERAGVGEPAGNIARAEGAVADAAGGVEKAERAAALSAGGVISSKCVAVLAVGGVGIAERVASMVPCLIIKSTCKGLTTRCSGAIAIFASSRGIAHLTRPNRCRQHQRDGGGDEVGTWVAQQRLGAGHGGLRGWANKPGVRASWITGTVPQRCADSRGIRYVGVSPKSGVLRFSPAALCR